jgi:predicted amidohydrolase
MKPIRIASISVTATHGTPSDFKPTLRKAEQLILEVGRGSPDIICLPETFAHCALKLGSWSKAGEDLCGETVSRFSALAKKLGCIILCPILEKLEGRTYNSLVFISAKGKVMGSYHKMIPTIGEMEAKIWPNPKMFVVDTPVGRLAGIICFDLNFSEIHNALRKERPHFIFFSSMFRGGLRSRYLALETGAYVIVSNASSNQLINPLGRLINKAGSRQESFAMLPQYLEETVNLNYGVYHLDYNTIRLPQLRNRYAGRIHLEVSQAEGVFLLESIDPKLSIGKIEKEFCLELSVDYFDRARTLAKSMRPDMPV